MSYRILSINGGGIRGIFQATYLKEVKKSFESLLHENFELIAGTSTGSIIALAVALNIDMEKVVYLFRSKGEEIFSPRLFASIRKGARYKKEPLEKALKDIFEEYTLKDCKENGIDVVITATTLDSFDCRVFSTLHSPDVKNHDLELSVVEVIMSSCAAPTFFEPAQLTNRERHYIDGGIWANTPSLLAICHAYNYSEIAFRNMQVVSLGNGEISQGLTVAQYNNLMPIGMISPLFNMMFATQSIAADGMVGMILGEENLMKINTTLENAIDLDEVDNALTKLPPLAEHEARESVGKLKEFLRNK